MTSFSFAAYTAGVARMQLHHQNRQLIRPHSQHGVDYGSHRRVLARRLDPFGRIDRELWWKAAGAEPGALMLATFYREDDAPIYATLERGGHLRGRILEENRVLIDTHFGYRVTEHLTVRGTLILRRAF